jgi:hypothetical protein
VRPPVDDFAAIVSSIAYACFAMESYAMKSSLGKQQRVRRRAALLEQLESRRLLAAVSPPAFLQWFDSSFDTIEHRTPDIFQAGYGAVWLPPPGRADSGEQSVGYDAYDRFDLG